MKDSGIEWIGVIPDGWSIHRLKSCVLERDSGAWGSDASGNDGDMICLRIADFDYGRYRFKDVENPVRRNYDKATIERLVLKKNDLLVEKSGGGDKTPVGRMVMFDKDYPALYANFMDRLRCRNFVIPKWFLYLWNTFYSNGYVWSYIKQTTGLQNYDLTGMLTGEKVALPSLKEQQQIADFLDAKCASIDDVIAKTNESVEEYKKLKRAVITEAVTRGVRGERNLKDSGIDWVKKLPVEWNQINPKALFSLRKDRATETDRQLTSSQQYGVIYQDEYMQMTGNKVVVVEKDFDILKHVEAGDFVISMRSFQGGLEYSTNTGSISSAYVMLIPNLQLVEPRYYRWLLKSPVYINALQSTSNLVRDGQAMRYSNFAQVRLFKVPLDEQREIADYLDSKCAAIDTLISKKQQFIDELTAYKKSLIYEYVTGKKEVPA